MLHSRVQIDHLNWVVSLKDSGELIFYFEKLEIDEYAGLFWDGGDDSPSQYFANSVDDNVLPENVSPIKVIRKLIKEIISLVNRRKVNFFYFSPSTTRKSKFYINIFMTYLPLLKGKWGFQIIDNTWFYFTKATDKNLYDINKRAYIDITMKMAEKHHAAFMFTNLKHLNFMQNKKVIYIDMDGTLVDFKSGIATLTEEELKVYGPSENNDEARFDEVSGIFARMKPLPGAIDAFRWIAEHFDAYILSTAPWENPSAWRDKLEWAKKHLGTAAYKRLILSHHKNLLMGDYLIDDNTKNGAGEFMGKHLHFGHDYRTGEANSYPTWDSVLDYLQNNKD